MNSNETEGEEKQGNASHSRNSTAPEARKETAIAALISSPTLQSAAKIIGVNEATLWKWLQEPRFKADYRDARREVVAHAIAQLQNTCGVAVLTLEAVATDEEAPASARVSAARAILDNSVKAVELENVVSRIEALEELQRSRDASLSL